jgi:hypothetical protein
MIGRLTVYAHFQRDGNDTDTVVAVFENVDVSNRGVGSTGWFARDKDGALVAEINGFDDYHVGLQGQTITIDGALVYPRGAVDDYGHWELTVPGDVRVALEGVSAKGAIGSVKP